MIILTGLPGSGKSSLLKALREAHSSIKIVNYGEKMLLEGTLHGLTRDQLRKLPIEEQQEVGRLAAIQIAKEKIDLLDTHACIKTEVGFCPGLPIKVLQELHPSALVFIECSPKTILERRQADKSRQRDEESEKALTLHREMALAYLAAASTFTGAVLSILPNEHGSPADNIRPLMRLLENLT